MKNITFPAPPHQNNSLPSNMDTPQVSWAQWSFWVNITFRNKAIFSFLWTCFSNSVSSLTSPSEFSLQGNKLRLTRRRLMAGDSPDVQEESHGVLVLDPGEFLPRRPHPIPSKLPLVSLDVCVKETVGPKEASDWVWGSLWRRFPGVWELMERKRVGPYSQRKDQREI